MLAPPHPAILVCTVYGNWCKVAVLPPRHKPQVLTGTILVVQIGVFNIHFAINIFQNRSCVVKCRRSFRIFSQFVSTLLTECSSPVLGAPTEQGPGRARHGRLGSKSSLPSAPSPPQSGASGSAGKLLSGTGRRSCPRGCGAAASRWTAWSRGLARHVPTRSLGRV